MPERQVAFLYQLATFLHILVGIFPTNLADKHAVATDQVGKALLEYDEVLVHLAMQFLYLYKNPPNG